MVSLPEAVNECVIAASARYVIVVTAAEDDVTAKDLRDRGRLVRG
jgi:hypothetical protein